MDEVEFPILGTEPIAVEFANTRYGMDDDQIDFLYTSEWIDQWFGLIGLTSSPMFGTQGEQVRVLRDAVYALFDALIDRCPAPAKAVEVVNAAAAAAPTYLRLDWVPGAVAASRVDVTANPTAILGRIADCCIELVAGPNSSALRRCCSPVCTVMFVRRHHRRNYCDPACGHRTRQARYYRRRMTKSEAVTSVH